jgi:hypothetical protein
MENISPKKYIQTRARALPIYKCFVNEGWEEAGMADVVVLRQHVTKTVTGAVFLVDLKCLGIKDTFWMFNVPANDIYGKLPSFKEQFVEIDYTLAHNIIFAGHDFAMDYDIAPHKDFAITKFIVEEDNDEIPLADIAVGEDGVPHLITHNPGEYQQALAKLRKNAGEGNYHYTIGVGGSYEYEDDDGKYDEDDEFVPLAEIGPGLLDPNNVEDVAMHELVDKELTDQRDLNEQLTIMAEVNIRILEPVHELTEEEENLIDKEWDYRNEHNVDYTQAETDMVTVCIEKIIENKVAGSFEAGTEIELEELDGLRKCIEEANGNPYLLALLNVTELSIDAKEVAPLLLVKLESQRDHDIIKLSLALRELVTNHAGFYKSYAEQPSYENVFSGKSEGSLHEDCLHLYYLIQVIRYSKSESIGLAIAYYRLLTTNFETVFFEFSASLFYPFFLSTLGKHTEIEMLKKQQLRKDKVSK